ncbi:Kinetochore protein spc25 [Rhynchospora pubera]|uniref:Kinetochore protein SPC25 n=1 Tax=Rhynchospora pubera TaxID=906938 RepID=A0AAV8EY88_9POAL|nr:Kinetochore protein spc25 [Rhynchospora pubera]
MQGIHNGDKPIPEAMTELRLSFERRVSDLRERSSVASASFSRCLRSSRVVADDYLASLEKLDKLKDELREGQAKLAEQLSVKTRNGARYAAMTKDLEAKKAKCEQIKKMISDQRNKVDECASIIAKSLHALEACEENLRQGQSEKENLDSAIAWYQKSLGLQVVEGEGVKFIFNKIDSTNPDKEYSFTVRLDNDKYNLLRCDPLVEGIDDLLKEVNKTNDFFGFVRIMREKFAASNFSAVKAVSITQASLSGDTSLITGSSPVELKPSIVTPSIDKTGAKSKMGIKTPTSSVRRSARLQNIQG